MEIIIKRRKAAITEPVVRKPLSSDTGKRLGAWAIVKAQHAEDHTVDIILDSGNYLQRLPVASREWVVAGSDAETERDFNAGFRDLPPVHARVYVLMPSGSYSDCFVAPFSGFNITDLNASSPFLAKEKEHIRERITPSGWHISSDNDTGSYRAVSPDGKTYVNLDYGNKDEPKESDPCLTLSFFEDVTLKHLKGESWNLKIFDTEILIEKGGMTIKPKTTTIEVDGDATIKTSGAAVIEATGDATVKGKNITVEATVKAEVKGAMVQIDGNVAPSSGPFCGIPSCLFTGAPHGGNIAVGG